MEQDLKGYYLTNDELLEFNSKIEFVISRMDTYRRLTNNGKVELWHDSLKSIMQDFGKLLAQKRAEAIKNNGLSTRNKENI
jgi:hypothetical protein